VKEAAAKSRKDHAADSLQVGLRQTEAHKAKSIDAQPKCEQLSFAETIRQHADRVGRNEIGKHQNRHQERGVLDGRDRETPLSLRIR
jgi:hypothetical protein